MHGQQKGRAFHGYDGDLVSYLRPSNADPARNARAILKLLERLLAWLQKPTAQAAATFEATKENQWHFVRLVCAAKSRDRPRCVTAKAEHTAKGANPRFILTSLDGGEQKIYDETYCTLGETDGS